MPEIITYYLWWIKTVIEFYLFNKANFIAWGPIVVSVPATIVFWLAAKIFHVKYFKYSCLLGLGLLPFVLFLLFLFIFIIGRSSTLAIPLYMFLIAPQYVICYLIAMVFLMFRKSLNPTIVCIVFVTIQGYGVYWTYGVYLRF